EAIDRLRGDGGVDDPRRRVRGTTAANPSGPTFQQYKLRLAAQFPRTNPSYTAASYDAAYVVAYGIAAGSDLSGAGIAKGIHRLLAGDAIDVGPSNIGRALNTLASGASFNLNGASGALDFDAVTGDVIDDIDVWCIGLDLSQKATQVSSGLLYSATTGKF